ncbi:hypothetical protein QWJ34_07280 [Saccharibacillus sp. CPCC 101409]|uniref:hypothetical protein n=1 Tax=Saccharibacillus sp. CPCC 101409 TaxID=3058041 RepID=UPI00267379D9|nr:hypothetical protein [Saccharibacillus sp. CPCC 101409]MDO3409561.1 hypothetical protein [Saccharibacillus sp. CPCC 101409]
MSEEQAGGLRRLEALRERGAVTAEEADWIEGLLRELEEEKARSKRLREALLKANGQKPTMSTKLRDALYE